MITLVLTDTTMVNLLPKESSNMMCKVADIDYS